MCVEILLFAEVESEVGQMFKAYRKIKGLFVKFYRKMYFFYNIKQYVNCTSDCICARKCTKTWKLLLVSLSMSSRDLLFLDRFLKLLVNRGQLLLPAAASTSMQGTVT